MEVRALSMKKAKSVADCGAATTAGRAGTLRSETSPCGVNGNRTKSAGLVSRSESVLCSHESYRGLIDGDFVRRPRPTSAPPTAAEID